MNASNKNPLLCDPETGICELPVSDSFTGTERIYTQNKPIKITYYTDPICSTCWGIEPQLRKLKFEYGDIVDIDYHMGGLLPDWSYNSGGISKPSDVAPHWEEVSAYYDMPIDGDVWLEDPLPSSYPPSIAIKAAQLQDKDKAVWFMRKLRELLFLEKKNITKWEVIYEAAIASNLDVVQLKQDYEGKAIDLFEADLAYGRQLGVRGFPTLFFTGADNKQCVLYGFKPYKIFEESLLTVFPKAEKKAIHLASDYSLFNYYPTLTSKEYSVLAEISMKVAGEKLEKLFSEGKINKTVIKNGVLYKAKSDIL